jgi:hypothetical protein
MTANPFSDAKQRVDRQSGEFALQLARVIDVPSDATHQVLVESMTKTSERTVAKPTPATVITAATGDISLPKAEDVVILGKLPNGQDVVLGSVYWKNSVVRDYDAAERHIGRDDGGGVWLHGPFAAAPKRTDDPTDAPNGAVWYRDDLDEYRGQRDGNTVSFDTTQV